MTRSQRFVTLGLAVLGVTSFCPAAWAAEEDVWRTHMLGAQQAFRERNFLKAEVELQAAIKVAEAAQPQDDRLIESLGSLVMAYVAQGKYEPALEPAKRIVEVQEKKLGPTHLGVAAALNDLGGLYKDQKKFDEAEPLFKRAGSILEGKTAPRELLLKGMVQYNLCEMYRDQKKLDEAEKAGKEALAIREAVFGPGKPAVGDTLRTLASVYTAAGKFADAEAAYRGALAIRSKTQGWNRPVMVESLIDVAEACAAQDKNEDAERSFRDALRLGQEGLGKSDGLRADACEKYAKLLRKLKRDDEAVKAEEAAKAIREAIEKAQQQPAADTPAPAPAVKAKAAAKPAATKPPATKPPAEKAAPVKPAAEKPAAEK